MSDKPLLDRLRAALAGRTVREQKMFGGTCFMLQENMLAGVSKRGLLVRVGKEGHAEALRRPHAAPMEMGGRTMQGYVFVAPEGTRSDNDLREWLDRALSFVETLPRKPPKVKAPKSRRRAG